MRLHAQRHDWMKPELRSEIVRVFRASMGPRRAGLAMVYLHHETSLYTLPPDNSRILDATQVLWRPGSTVKPFLLERLLDAKLVDAASKYLCRGKTRVAGRVLDCSHADQPAPLLPAEALALSCNEYFLHYASRLPIGAFAHTLMESGFTNRQPFGRSCAPAVVQPPPNMDSHLLQCVGASHVFTSPLALLGAFTRLLARMQTAPESAASRILYQGMQECVNQGSGMEARVPGLEIAGKTGTGSARARTHLNGWFLSFAPTAAPRFAMVTFVEHGSGGADAAPLAGAVWQVLGEHGVLG
jgi:penicillin-binding protein 2